MWHKSELIDQELLQVKMLQERMTSVSEACYNLKLSSKRLKSGKCQVKFSALLNRRKQLYGYMLVNADDTLKEVVTSIKSRLDLVKDRDTIHHINLYSVGKRSSLTDNFIVFDA
ncbi:MAG: hypothetical protein RIC80_11115 [Cyclobacteriaceae bacterium]